MTIMKISEKRTKNLRGTKFREDVSTFYLSFGLFFIIFLLSFSTSGKTTKILSENSFLMRVRGAYIMCCACGSQRVLFIISNVTRFTLVIHHYYTHNNIISFPPSQSSSWFIRRNFRFKTVSEIAKLGRNFMYVARASTDFQTHSYNK